MIWFREATTGLSQVHKTETINTAVVVNDDGDDEINLFSTPFSVASWTTMQSLQLSTCLMARCTALEPLTEDGEFSG